MVSRTIQAKVSLSLRSLQRALSNVTPAIERKSPTPALSAVRIQSNKGAIEFTGTNELLSIRSRHNVAGAEESGPMLLPAYMLEAFARLLEGDVISLTATSPERAMLRCGGTSTKLAMLPNSGYPHTELPPDERAVSILQPAMERMLHYTAFAVGREQTQANLRGALCEVAEGKASLIATDGHRLARYSVPSKAADLKMMLPEALLAAMDRVADRSAGGSCSLAANEAATFACFEGDAASVFLSHRPVSGQFPNYRAILPTKAEASVRVNAAGMVSAVKRCMSIADSNAQVVKVSISPSEMQLYSVGEATGETTERLSVSSSLQFPPLTLYFRGSYLLDALTRIQGEVALSFAKVGASMGLWIKHSPAEGESFEYVLMNYNAPK